MPQLEDTLAARCHNWVCHNWVCPVCGSDCREDYATFGPVALTRIGGDSANGYEAHHTDCLSLWGRCIDEDGPFSWRAVSIRRWRGRPQIVENVAQFDRLFVACFGRD